MGGPAYTPEQLDALRRLAAAKKPFKAALKDEPSLSGRAIPSIRQKLRTMGLRINVIRDTWSPFDAVVLQLIDDNGPMSARELARLSGCSRNSVIRVCERQGLKIVDWANAVTPLYGHGQWNKKRPPKRTNSQRWQADKRRKALKTKPKWIPYGIAA